MKTAGKPEDIRKHLTAEEYQWAEKNVLCYKKLKLGGVDCIMLSLIHGGIAIAETIEEAVRMEMEGTGTKIEIGEK